MKPKRLVAWIIPCLLLTACVAPVDLIKMDNEWARAYSAKLEAERATPDQFLVAMTTNETSEAQMVDLSIRAEKAGDAIAAKDPATAVGFYRIAAASAWKSGRGRETQVLAIGDKAAKACKRLPNQDASQPRDCAFIRVVPQLALFDIKAREIRELVGAAATIPPEKHERSVALVEEIGGSPDGILDQLLSAHHSVKSVAPSLVEYLASNLNREYCTLEEFTGLFAGSGPKAEQKEKVVETVQKAEARLSAAQISTTCTP